FHQLLTNPAEKLDFSRSPIGVAKGVGAICEKQRTKSSQALIRHWAEIRRIIASHRAGNARVFGSVLHGEDNEDSDLDLLIDPNGHMTLFDIGAGGIARCRGGRTHLQRPSRQFP
ncbi:nucleotidyltransferase family protein, partial [Candidatus Thiosymbion oneisti]|uniref:nucleotidyltransferase family protein n=1 Tax=Candidatus Thiosymbion oneisti TaxID=589554 RepID=UPI003F6DC4D0